MPRTHLLPQAGEVLVIVCPGQGAQTPGFLSPWLELPGFRDRLEWLSAAASIDLVKHGTESDADTIRDTAIAQPLIVGAGLVSMLALFAHPADGFRSVRAGAGHSVGEITAAAATGVLSAEQAMILVRERGAAMASASAITPTGMSAVVGGEPEEVETRLREYGLTPANMNGAGQVVAAGTMEQLTRLAENPPAKARVIPLQVAGAFHTTHMQPAVARLQQLSRAVSTRDARVPLVSNADGQIVREGREVLRRIVNQVSNPVRWDLCMQTFRDMGVTGLIEIPPAGTLANLAKRQLPGVDVLALKSPDDIARAHAMIAEHSESGLGAADEPTWRLVVSPMKGLFERDELEAGTEVDSGMAIGAVKTLRETVPVTAIHAGHVVEWLVEDGDPVSPGQPLLRLHPVEV